MRLILTVGIATAIGFLAGYALFGERVSQQGERASVVVRRGVSDSETVSETVRDRPAEIFAALANHKHRLRCLSELYVAVQQLQPGDFTLFNDPDALKQKLREVPGWCVEALLTGFTERWLEADPNAARAWLEATPHFLKDARGADSAIRVFARKLPEAMLAYALSDRGTAQQRKNIAQLLIEETGRRDLARAKEMISVFSDKAMRAAAETGWRIALAKNDPFAAADLIATMEDRTAAQSLAQSAIFEAAERGPGVLRVLATKMTDPEMRLTIANAMAESDLDEAARMASEALHKWTGRYSLWLGELCEKMVRRDAVRAAEWASALPTNAGAEVLAQVARQWAADDPRAALAWFEEHHRADATTAEKTAAKKVTDPRIEAFDAWLRRDEQGAREWATKLASGELRDAANACLITHLTQRERSSEAAAVFAQMDPEKNGALAGRVTQQLARDDPLAAAQWAAELPAGRAQSAAIPAAVKAWTFRDPQAVAAWIAQFPPSETRDRAVIAYVQTSAIADPTGAAAWVGEVADSWRRTIATRGLFWQWNLRDPERARAWLQGVPGVNEAERLEMLGGE